MSDPDKELRMDSEDSIGSQDEKTQNTYEGKFSELWHYKTLRYNLLVLMFCWMACSFGYFLLAYVLKYLGGSIFINAYTSSFAELAGKLSTIFILQCTSVKRVFLISFGLALLGTGLLILFR